MSKNTAKSLTTKYDKFEAERLSFTPLEDNERSKGQKIAYPRYNHPTHGENQPLFIQGPWMTMFNYGVPTLGEYYKEDKDRAFVKCPLDMEDPEVVKMVEELKKVDEQYASGEFKTESFGKYAKKYSYQTIVRQPPSDEDDEVTRPAYMKLKLDLTWPDCNVKTVVVKSELVETEDGSKRVREELEVETVGDFANHVNYMCKFRPIFRPVKMWAHQQKMKDPQYGIVFKLIKIEVEPSKNNNSLYQNYLSGDVFLDDDEEEVVSRVQTTTKSSKKASKQTKKVVEDSDSSDESESSDDSDDSDSEEEVVAKKTTPKKRSKKSKSKKNSS